jgi:thioredoxin reductase (NADPH)
MSEKLQIKNQNSQSFDVIIIGGGAAGISAALWCDELGLKALLLESETKLGGQLLRVYNPIKNHLGVEAENGRTLLDIFVRQIAERKFTINYKSEITKADLKEKKVFLKTGETFSARALIIATGVRRRKLGVEGEDEFKGRGIIESGKRDQELVVGKSVCIVGGGDAALENALILSETAARIFLVHRGKIFRARSEFTEKVLANEKVKVLTETFVTKTIGRGNLEALELQNLKTGEIFTLPVQALLIRIGVEPNTELFQGNLNLDKNGYVEINGNCETSIENVFATGDVANPFAPTVSSAVGMGATAAKVIFHNLNQ